MNYMEQDVLKALIKRYKETGSNSIDTTFCNATQNIALKQLKKEGYIKFESKLTGTVSLADFIIKDI